MQIHWLAVGYPLHPSSETDGPALPYRGAVGHMSQLTGGRERHAADPPALPFAASRPRFLSGCYAPATMARSCCLRAATKIKADRRPGDQSPDLHFLVAGQDLIPYGGSCVKAAEKEVTDLLAARGL